MEGVIPEGRKVKRDERWFAQEIDRLREGVTSTGPRGRLDRYFLQQLAPLKEELLGVGVTLAAHQGRHPETIIHGDFGPEHLLVHNGSILAVLDFANAHLNMRVADVGRSLVEFSKGPGPWLDLTIARDFLRAYREGYSLHEEELALLPEWMILWNLKLVNWLQTHRAEICELWMDRSRK
jgi:Ser/Thr protein kinase RdoA (MazF antagonist)